MPFGRDSPALLQGLNDSADAMKSVVPTLRVYEAPNSNIFRSKAALSEIGDTRWVANTSDACRLEVEESGGLHLLVPFWGNGRLMTEGNTYQLRAGAHCVLLPSVRRTTEKASGSMTIVSLDPDRLSHTIATMFGNLPLDEGYLQRPHLMDNSRYPALLEAFQKLLGFVDLAQKGDDICARLGLDDFLYRWISESLSPHHDANDVAPPRASKNSQIDMICDMIRTATDRPLTLTEMEACAGISARNLQYAFRARFNCSPMEWQRRERMLSARQRVLSSAPCETLTQIAYSMGFSSLAAFTTMYVRYFHETPSQSRERL